MARPAPGAYRVSTDPTCQECGNDDALEGFRFCLDCLDPPSRRNVSGERVPRDPFGSRPATLSSSRGPNR
jgi:hypothetical protein